MLKTMNSVSKVKKSDYKHLAQEIRMQLLQLQFQTNTRNKPVIIVVAGDDRSGRHETINALMEWLDPRFIRANAYGPVEKLDEQKPFFWRYWRDLPSAGKIGIYLREWTSTSIVQFLNEEISEKKLARRIQYIQGFEKTLCDDGALIIKFWLHLSKDAHENRVSEIKNTPFFDPKDELALKNYDKAIKTFDKVLSQTHTSHAPWHVINGEEPLQRNLVVGEAIVKQMTYWLGNERPNIPTTAPPSISNSNILDSIDLSLSISKDDYKAELKNCRSQLRGLMTKAQQRKLAVVCVFEGADAAGKGGAIRRMVSAIDAGLYRIVPVAKPSDEEYAHHYLWRFWRHMPGEGLMTIFDRSWYGRVLVERVEEFASPNEWQRAYSEINDFEEQLNVHGTIIVKYWLHIDQKEQLKRFEARENTPHKQHKITEEDYRNRQKWPDYREAIHDMLVQTDTSYARWNIIPAQDKKYARIAVFRALIDALKSQLY